MGCGEHDCAVKLPSFGVYSLHVQDGILPRIKSCPMESNRRCFCVAIAAIVLAMLLDVDRMCSPLSCAADRLVLFCSDVL